MFEYMAMGKGIVASRLGQVREVLDHGRTGALVEPGGEEALVSGGRGYFWMSRSRRLGEAARRTVVQWYT